MGGVGLLLTFGFVDLGFFEPEGRRLETSLASKTFSKVQ
jgi:hypothetical protein